MENIDYCKKMHEDVMNRYKLLFIYTFFASLVVYASIIVRAFLLRNKYGTFLLISSIIFYIIGFILISIINYNLNKNEKYDINKIDYKNLKKSRDYKISYNMLFPFSIYMFLLCSLTVNAIHEDIFHTIESSEIVNLTTYQKGEDQFPACFPKYEEITNRYFADDFVGYKTYNIYKEKEFNTYTLSYSYKYDYLLDEEWERIKQTYKFYETNNGDIYSFNYEGYDCYVVDLSESNFTNFLVICTFYNHFNYYYIENGYLNKNFSECNEQDFIDYIEFNTRFVY